MTTFNPFGNVAFSIAICGCFKLFLLRCEHYKGFSEDVDLFRDAPSDPAKMPGGTGRQDQDWRDHS